MGGLFAVVVGGFGDDVAPVEVDGIDVFVDDGAGVTVFDVLHEDVGVEFVDEVAYLDAEVRFGEDDVDFDFGVLFFEAAFEVEGLGAGIGTGECGYLDAVARHCLGAFVELYMFLNQLADLDVAGDFDAAFLGMERDGGGGQGEGEKE